MFTRVLRGLIRRLFEFFGNHFFLDPNSWTVIRCRFDGEDFIHTWKNGSLVWFEPTPMAVHITQEDLELFMLNSNIEFGAIILIAGAGMGTEVRHFSSLVGHSGKVIAIEPDEVAFRRLAKLSATLPLQNLILIKAAVGSKEGLLDLFKFDTQTVTNTLMNTGMPVLSKVKVPVTTINQICNDLKIDSIDYLKMNIEGAEYDALIGASDVRVSQFCISCHDFLGPDFATYTEVTKCLLDSGYEIQKHPEEQGKPWVGSYVYARKEFTAKT